MPDNEVKVAAAYIRVSTDDQLEYSPDSQLDIIKKHAKQNNYVLLDEYIFMENEGLSGRHADKRPEFQRMIATVRAGEHPIDVILVWAFSRFARNQEESMLYKGMLRRDGVEVVSVSQPLIEGPFGGLIERIIEWMDEYYSTNLSNEVRRGMTERAKRGGINTRPPFGYIIKKKGETYTPDPNAAPIVKAIFERYADGATKADLVRMCLDMGAMTTHGRPFDNRMVDWILNNPTYKGYLRWSPSGRIGRDYDNPNVIIAKGTHEPIVSVELWQAVHDRYQERKRLFPQAPRIERTDRYMLYGLVRCGDCKAVMTRQNYAQGKTSLQCQNYNKQACTSHSITLKKINSAVIAQIRADSTSKFIEIGTKSNKLPPAPQLDIQKQISREEQKIERARAAYQAGIDTLEEYKETKDKILKIIDQLKSSKATSVHTISVEEFQGKLKSALRVLEDDGVTEEAKNLLLRTFIDRIVFYRTKGEPDSMRIFYYA